MFIILYYLITLASLYITLRPLITFFRNEKGFRKYPSQNWLSGVTALAYGWEVGRKHDVFHTRRLHDALMKNPVIRVGPNWLSFGNSRAAKDIYGYNSLCKKGTIYAALQGGGKNLVNMVDRSQHSHRRRMVAVAYAPKNVEVWEPHIADSAARVFKNMDKMCTAPLSPKESIPKTEDLKYDGVYWSYLFAVEAVVKIGLSKDLHFTEAGNDLFPIGCANGKFRNISFRGSFRGGVRATSTLVWDTNWFPFLKKATRALSAKYRENWQHGEDSAAIVTQLVKERTERYKDGEILDDLFQPMIEDKSGATPEIDDQDKIAETDQMSMSSNHVLNSRSLISLIVNGGVDSTATSLVCTLYYLIKNPETLQKLREELDSALSPTDSIAPWSKVRKLQYLRACVDESMRLSPPVATDLIRRTPPEGAEIDGQMVPGNTEVSISAYTAHRDPMVFPDPEAFRPERWLAKGDDRMKDMLTSFIPFSAGSRSCIGRNVTILEQQVFLATLCYRYEFALPGREWEMEWEDYFNLWPVKLPLKIWRRGVEASG